MSEVLTLEEIKRRYDGEWILVEDPQTNADLEVERGKVICHSVNRDEVYRQAATLRPRRFAVLYTGPDALPENTAVVL